MRVVTYNIRGALGMDGLRSIRRIAEVLQQIDADVICLQEVHKRLPWSQFKDQPGVLSRLLGKQAIFQSNYRVGFGGFGNLILTSLPILSHSSHPLPNENERRSMLRKPEKRGILEVRMQTDHGPLAVFTTHWSLDAADRMASAEAAAVIINSVGAPVILCGDFNALPDSAEISAFIAKSRLEDAAAWKPQNTFTSDNPTERIDYIVISEELEGANLQVIETQASDHLPVVLEFSMRERNRDLKKAYQEMANDEDREAEALD